MKPDWSRFFPKGHEVKQYRPHLLVGFALAVVLFSGLHQGLHNILTDVRFRWTSRPASGKWLPLPPSLRRATSGKTAKHGARHEMLQVAFSREQSFPIWNPVLR